jgi:lipopolysaccharide transport system permease protein
LFHALMSLAVLLLGLAALGKLSFWALALPLVWAPLLLFTAGVAWFLAALGVFLRDISQAAGPLVTAVLFLSPVFYPASAMPENLRPWLFLNPLTVPIEAMRALTYGNQPPNWVALGIHALACALTGFLGWLWFTKTQKGFADVL